MPKTEPTIRGIIFSGPMVNALLAGTKTQTRRLLVPRGKKPSLVDGTWSESYILDPGNAEWLARDIPHAKGDRLYVRESYAPGYFDGGLPGYKADWTDRASDVAPEPKWTPAIHMKRHASRLWLEVVEVRAERLQAITDVDALAEGCRSGFVGEGADRRAVGPRETYAALWDSLHGAGSWDSNPWVYALTFEVHHGNVDQAPAE